MIGGFFRLFKSDWGEGIFYHPDEYHIVSAVNRINLPEKANPEMFSYGSSTVYLIYFVKNIVERITNTPPNVFLVGRTLAGIFSTATLFVIYMLSEKIFKNTPRSLLATLLVAFTPGLIQQAHFTTPESFLIFWIFLCILLFTHWIHRGNKISIIFSAICLGIAIGTKITALFVYPVFALSVFIPSGENPTANFFNKLLKLIILTAIVVLSFLTVFPYSLLDKTNFLSSLDYETAVGRGSLIVFYTRQFIDTSPIIFHFYKVFPYALGIPMMLAGAMGCVYMFINTLRSKEKTTKNTSIIILASFLTLLAGNVFLHVKWTRFVAPTFPFFSIFCVYLIGLIKHSKGLLGTYVALLCVLTALWSGMFFSIYRNSDTRASANVWINKNIPTDSVILTESGNTYEVPLSGTYTKIPFDFYNLENNLVNQSMLVDNLLIADYFIVQSRRVYANSVRLENLFPFTSNFYTQLFNGNLGFEKVATFNSYPTLRLGGRVWSIDDEKAEETWSVFDHPVLVIYKKTTNSTKNFYEKIL